MGFRLCEPVNTDCGTFVQSIKTNLEALQARIENACSVAGRDPREVTLIAVSKTKPSSAVREAAGLGLIHFGENYLDEAIEKIADSADLNLTWHFIGRIQSNKTRTIAEQFDWVHTLDRFKIARRLNEQCPAGKQLNVLLQINIDNDPAKAGVIAEEADRLLAEISTLPALRPRGLMTILAQQADPVASYQSMAQLSARLAQQLSARQQQDWGTIDRGAGEDGDPFGPCAQVDCDGERQSASDGRSARGTGRSWGNDHRAAVGALPASQRVTVRLGPPESRYAAHGSFSGRWFPLDRRPPAGLAPTLESGLAHVAECRPVSVNVLARRQLAANIPRK